MAKTKTRKKSSAKSISKSDAIRAVLKQKPNANVKEVQEALAQRGVKASDALVNKIKYGRGSKSSAKKASKSTNGRSTVNKADAIRGAWGELGRKSRPRDVIALLASRGLTVTSAQVSTLRKSAGRKSGSIAASVHAVPFDHLLAAKGLVERLGSIENAQQALANLAQLMHA